MSPSSILVRTILVSAALALLALPIQSSAQSPCLGDCNADGQVTVSELVTQVNVALDRVDLSACELADANQDGRIAVNELVSGVNSLLRGCSVAPTPMPTGTTTPMPTGTTTPMPTGTTTPMPTGTTTPMPTRTTTPMPTRTTTPTPDGGCSEGAGTTFNSTFEAIQEVIFNRHGCSDPVCHGSLGMQGGLDLSPEVAFDNIFQQPSVGSTLELIYPGNKDRSYLWLKLAAKTDPSLLPAGFEITGVPMPNGLPAISEDELDALRLWINAGAGEEGIVPGTLELLDACVPPPGPILTEPLDPPAPGTGVQFVMPE